VPAAICALAAVVAQGQQRIEFPTPVAPMAPAPAPLVYGQPPVATLNGGIQPPPPTWDPYGTPGAAAPALVPAPIVPPQDPYVVAPGQYLYPSYTADAFARMYRALQEVRFDYHYFPRNSDSGLGINDAELSATFTVPLLYSPQTPLLLTPGFAAHFWDGPSASGTPSADMPPETYDAYLDAAWNPILNNWLSTELDFRIGVYSDFKKFEEDSLRYTAKAMAVMGYAPEVRIKAGVWYLDRVRVKMLPAGGIVWTPNPDTRIDLLFPNPKYTQRLATVGCTDWWWYFSGDYGGGTWTIKRSTGAVAGELDQVDYNDIRIALGLDFKRLSGSGLNGLMEVGYAFDRELVYRGGNPSTYSPNGTVFLRAGLAY
jgi:hypothetical protein